MHIYDYIVIGSGLSGLITAHKISQETNNVLLIEAEAQLGGANKTSFLNGQEIENGVRFIPATKIAEKSIIDLENLLSIKLIKEKKENNIQTYEASGFKSFVGFGERAPDFYDEVSYFLNPKEFELNLTFHQIIERLKQGYKGQVVTKSIVTSFHHENEKITHVMVNGAKTYAAQNFIFAGNAADLIHLLPDDILSLRAKTKLKKETSWMGVCLDFYHDVSSTPAETNPNLFLLEGTTQDAIGPCVGRFLPAACGNDTAAVSQISQWMGFIDVELAEESENIAEVIKKMKRQIKRAFPLLAESIKAEKLFMTAPLSCGEIKLNANGTLAKTENLWIASSQVNSQKNCVGSIAQALFVLASLGFGNAELSPVYDEQSTVNETV